MTGTERSRIEAICDVANVENIGDLSDGFHTFNELYEQRMILFAVLVKAYKDKAWKSYRHEDGEYCFGGGWFIVGIDTPEGSYTYHYENKYWGMFDCVDLPRAKHWDGHTEADAETRLMSLVQSEQRWIPCSERLPKKHGESYLVTISDGAVYTTTLQWDANGKRWYLSFFNDGNILVDFIDDVIAWLPLPEPYQAERWE